MLRGRYSQINSVQSPRFHCANRNLFPAVNKKTARFFCRGCRAKFSCGKKIRSSAFTRIGPAEAETPCKFSQFPFELLFLHAPLHCYHQNHSFSRGFWTAVAKRSGGTAFRLQTELPKWRGASLPAAVQKDLVAATPRCALLRPWYALR